MYQLRPLECIITELDNEYFAMRFHVSQTTPITIGCLCILKLFVGFPSTVDFSIHSFLHTHTHPVFGLLKYDRLGIFDYRSQALKAL